jgi:hypothetical protein
MLRLPAYLTRFSSRSDGSAGITFTTQELTGIDFMELKRSLNEFGYLVFKENEVQNKDIPVEDAEEDKTPSKRLRATLYVYWQQHKKDTVPDFESYYRSQMDEIINYVKTKLV